MSFFNQTVYPYLICICLIVCGGVLPLGVAPAFAADEQTADQIETARDKAEKLREQIKDRQSEIAGYTRREKKVLDALNETEQQLARARQKVRQANAAMQAVSREMADTRDRIGALEDAIAKEQAHARRRLVALYKMRQLGEMNVLASADSMNEFLSRKAALEKILEHDQRVVAGLLDKQGELNEAMAALESQKKKKAALEEKHRESLARLKEKREAREKLLASIRNRKEDKQTTLKYLKTAAARLEKTIQALEPQTRSQSGSPSGAQSGAGKGGKQSFRTYQGLLNMPVEGTISANYGKYIEPHSGAANFRSGIEIKTHRGAPIRAVFSGKAVFSDWLKGYGNVVIIAHGNGYHSVYAHAEELFLSRGEPVKRGDVIATVGDTGSLSGTALYFEIRHHGNPVNPMEWIDNS